MKNIYELVNEYISGGESIVLACIIDHAGSTPREIGSKMIVHSDGHIEGSVGGGILEAMVQKIAAETFKNKQSSINKFSLDREEVASIGMTCGGNVAVYLKYIDAADSATRAAFESVTKLWSGNKKAWMITAVQPDGSFKLVPYAEESQAPAELNADFETLKEHFDHKSHFIDVGEKKYMIDPLVCSKAFIFGGGHIGYEMVLLLQRLDFYTTVIDDREEFASPERFPQADMCLAAPYYDAFSRLNIDKDSYIVIVTRGHIHDQAVLEQSLKTNAKYIGMIGSKTKRDMVFASLLEKGYTQNDINRVHAPIGLSIGAHTPEEIAVSIAAEMIQERAKVQR